jgi:hypothetical protein
MVAKRTDGWEGMLAGLLARWVEEAAREEREVHASDSQTDAASAAILQSQDLQVSEEVMDGQDLALGTEAQGVQEGLGSGQNSYEERE